MSNDYRPVTLDKVDEVRFNNFRDLKDSCVMSMSFQQNNEGVLWMLLSVKDGYKIVRLDTDTIGGNFIRYSVINGLKKYPDYHPHVLACNNNTMLVLYRSNTAWSRVKDPVKSYPMEVVTYDIHTPTIFEHGLVQTKYESFRGDFYNNKPTGAYVKGGRILYVTDGQYNRVFSYNVEDVSKSSYGKILEEKCLMLHPIHDAPRSLWFEDSCMMVHDIRTQIAYAYDLDSLDTKEDFSWFNGKVEECFSRNFGKTPVEDFAIGKLGGDIYNATVVAKHGSKYYVASVDGIIHVFQIVYMDKYMY